MATARQFEELICWQKARALARLVYSLTKTSVFARDRGLADQIQRAAVSVMSNIAEGFERGTKADFLNFLFIARGSAGEVRAQLYVARDLGYITEGEFTKASHSAEEASRVLYAFIQSVQKSQYAGLQRKKQVKSVEEEEQEMKDWIEGIRKSQEGGEKEV